MNFSSNPTFHSHLFALLVGGRAMKIIFPLLNLAYHTHTRLRAENPSSEVSDRMKKQSPLFPFPCVFQTGQIGHFRMDQRWTRCHTFEDLCCLLWLANDDDGDGVSFQTCEPSFAGADEDGHCGTSAASLAKPTSTTTTTTSHHL